MRCSGFEPFVNDDSEILILGSFPSVKSRAQNFYYGNPLNRFWKVLSESFCEACPVTIDEKQAMLKRHKIALWDIVAACEIEGSLDSSIRDYSVADISEIIEGSQIRKVILNGGTATKIFLRNYPQYSEIAVSLPSTSPANTRLDKSLWVEELKK